LTRYFEIDCSIALVALEQAIAAPEGLAGTSS
jgi:hypothetical protein